MEDIKDEENSDSSFTLSDFDSESDKEESLSKKSNIILNLLAIIGKK